MTKSEFEIFSNFFFEHLKVESSDILDIIEKNNKLIENYLNGPDNGYLKQFIIDFNTVVIETKVKNYKVFEKVLAHPSFFKVLDEFRKSDVLIRACKTANKKVVEWLLTMNLDYNTQDENGTTALMEASLHSAMLFVVEKLIKSNVNLNLLDNNGNNALFYATKNPDCLKKLLKTNIDVNQINIDNDSLLTYCCRMNRVRSLDLLKKEKSLDPNHYNCIGKTAAMYLVENAQYQLLKPFIKEKKIDPNYKNKFGESLVSCWIKKYYQQYVNKLTGGTKFTSNYNYIVSKNFAFTLLTLINLKCDFNIPVDDEGNTPIMVLLAMKDYVTTQYLLNNCSIDLSIENQYDINASYLSLFIDKNIFDKLNFNKIRNSNTLSYKVLMNTIQSNPTFDKRYKTNDDVIVSHVTNSTISRYSIVLEYAIIMQQWVMEIYFPKATSHITLAGNSFNDENPKALHNVIVKANTGGLI